jgi:hypothetical protein
MGLFTFGKSIVSIQEEKPPPKKPIKKAVKKSKPLVRVTSTAIRFTDKFVDFVKLLPFDGTQKRRILQRKKWAETIQEFFDSSEYGYIQVQSVFDWYSLHYQELWRIESPTSFIKHFPFLLKQYNRSINPYTTRQLKPVMRWLLRLQWDCSDSELEIIVGRSLWMVNQLCYSINSKQNKDYWKEIPNHYFLIINRCIGEVSDFIQIYFEHWFYKHTDTEPIRYAEITKKRILGMVYKWLNAYGADNVVVDRIISKLNCLKEIDFESEPF